jgi:hypothetical protein
MPRWTTDDLRRFLERGSAAAAAVEASTAEHEDVLHYAILDECARRGWLAFHGSMAHRTHRTTGEPDFVILVAGGRLLLVEAKSRQGKLSPIQQARIAHARKLGHVIHVVRSQKQFRELANRHENQSQEGL